MVVEVHRFLDPKCTYMHPTPPFQHEVRHPHAINIRAEDKQEETPDAALMRIAIRMQRRSGCSRP